MVRREADSKKMNLSLSFFFYFYSKKRREDEPYRYVRRWKERRIKNK